MPHLSEQRTVGEWRFPGFWQWLALLTVSTWVSAWLGAWADDRLTGHFPELTLFLLGRPLITGVFVLGGLMVWSLALQIRLKEALATGWRWILGIVFLPAALNLVVRALSLSTTPMPYAGGRDWLIWLVSTGWYPRLLATPGTLLTILGVSWFIGWTVWRWREQKTRGLLSGIGAYLFFLLILSIPTFYGWIGLEAGTSWWSAGAYSVQRGVISLSNQQYWWQSLYDRFPGMAGGEAEGSGQLLLLVSAYLVLIGACFFEQRQVLKAFYQSQKPFLRQAFGTYLVFLMAIAWFGLWLGFDRLTPGTFGVVSALALVTASVVGVLGWLLTQEYAQEFVEVRTGLVVAALIGAWLLGWPVFVGVALMSMLYWVRKQVPVQSRGLLALLGALNMQALLWTVWAIGSERAALDAMGAAGFLGVTIFFLSQLLASDSLKGLLAISEEGVAASWVNRSGGTRSAILFIWLGYVLLPLGTGWFIWLALTVPAAVISTLLVLGHGPDREKNLWRVATIFFLVSYFFLSVQGFHS